MSASTKKKLRKEEKAALLTERQAAEKAQAKKLKRNTCIFITVICLVVVAFVGLLVYRFIDNNAILENNSIAAEINGQELNSVDFNYYYTDAVQGEYNEWYSSASSMSEQTGLSIDEIIFSIYNFDSAKPLNEQYRDADATESWADYFLNQALSAAQEDIALCNAAKAAGFTLPDSDKEMIENQKTNLSSYAALFGYPSAKMYLSDMYGKGADLDSYIAYLERQTLADAYQTHYSEQVNAKIYSADEIASVEADDANKFNSYNYNYIYLGYEAFLEEQESEEYTDEQKDAARLAAKEAADTLTAATTVEEFDAAIEALEMSTTKSTELKNQLHTSVSSAVLRDWLAAGEHTEGEIAVLPNEAQVTVEGGEQETVINGYYVVRYVSTTDNKTPLNNIRHLLVSFDPDDSGVEVTDELKASTLEEAEALLAQWQEGEATEASFEALVREHSDDNADEGGLYTDVGAHTSFVEPFLNWCIDAERQVGDCEIVETEYGYHIMYYCGQTEYTYRDSMAMAELRTAELEKWHEDLIAATSASLKDLEYIKVDMVIGY